MHHLRPWVLTCFDTRLVVLIILIVLSSLLIIYVVKQLCRLFRGSRRAHRTPIIPTFRVNHSTSSFESRESNNYPLESIPEVAEALPLPPLPPPATASRLSNRAVVLQRADDTRSQHPVDVICRRTPLSKPVSAPVNFNCSAPQIPSRHPASAAPLDD